MNTGSEKRGSFVNKVSSCSFPFQQTLKGLSSPVSQADTLVHYAPMNVAMPVGVPDTSRALFDNVPLEGAVWWARKKSGFSQCANPCPRGQFQWPLNRLTGKNNIQSDNQWLPPTSTLELSRYTVVRHLLPPIAPPGNGYISKGSILFGETKHRSMVIQPVLRCPLNTVLWMDDLHHLRNPGMMMPP